MQQLQKPILNKIQPGLNPIFIISPNRNDGDILALLLSHYLEVPGTNQLEERITQNNKNYFSSPELQRLLNLIENTKFRNIQEDKAKIDLTFNTDFDNGILWGMQCSYQVFFDLGLHTLYENAFFIFLYGSPIADTMRGTSALKLLKKVKEFYCENQGNSILLEVNNTPYLGKILLQSLPLDISSMRIYPGEKNDSLLSLNNKYIFNHLGSANEESHELYSLLVKENYLLKNNLWFKGEEILAILITNNIPIGELLINKIHQLTLSLLSLPSIYIICKNEEDNNLIRKLFRDNSYEINAKIIICEKNILNCINGIIDNSHCDYIIIDYLNLAYSLTEILYPYKNEMSPVFNFGNILANKTVNLSSGKISLIDVLSTHVLFENIIFKRTVWEKVNGFDPLLGEKVMLWDFCIRALLIPESYALESAAVIANQQFNPNSEFQVITDVEYTDVIEKHKKLYSSNLDQVLKIVSENQYIPQTEIKTLVSKVTSLDVFLKHSKDEIRSLNDYSLSLQNRIRTLESSRLYRWGEKINHYKKIFFREKKPGRSTIKSIFKFIALLFSKAGFGIFRTILKRVFFKLYKVTEEKKFKIVYLEQVNAEDKTSHNKHFTTYHDWISAKLEYKKLKKEYDEVVDSLAIKPKISIILPVYNPPINFLIEAIESVVTQLYDNWELCIADDCSPNPQIKRILNSYSLKDNRIKVAFRTENGHISANSNSALSLATGDFVMLMDHDDALTQNCLFEFVNHINNHPDDQLVYSDEDKLENGVYSDPFFKPDYSPDKLLTANYISHVVFIDKKIIDKVGGFRIGFEGSQDFDLMLRCTEQTDKVGHISKILYHWRIHAMSVAGGSEAKPYAYIAAKKALEEALIRRGTNGEVLYQLSRGYYKIKYQIKNYDKVSIIIPTKDAAKLTRNTIDSIVSLTDYPNYEIIILNNNSTSKEFFELMDGYKTSLGERFKCVDAGFPFNFSKLINLGVSQSTGEYILMLNNDMEIIQKDWLTWMVSYAQIQRIGAVGVKLLYPDDTIQHAGVIVGLGGVADHAFVNYYKDDHGYFNLIQSVNNYSAVTGACLMCRRSVFDEVGGMDESLEVEFNDVDFCLKLIEKGYYNLYLPYVSLYHFESATRGHPMQTKENYERHLKELEIFKTRWSKYIKRDPFFNPNFRIDQSDFVVNYDA